MVNNIEKVIMDVRRCGGIMRIESVIVIVFFLALVIFSFYSLSGTSKTTGLPSYLLKSQKTEDDNERSLKTPTPFREVKQDLPESYCIQPPAAALPHF